MQSRRAHQSGMTLVELVVSLAVTSILLGGMMSAVLLASHALPDRGTPQELDLKIEDAANQIVRDLYCAKSFTERTATAIEFTVRDRNHGLAGPERIRYAWSGVLGEALTHQYNGGPVVDLIQHVKQFDLSYDLNTVTEGTPGPIEEVLSKQLCYTLPPPTAEQKFIVSTDNWCGHCFLPDPSFMPAGAVEWQMDYLVFRIMKEGQGNGFTMAQFRSMDGGGLPTTTVYDEYSIEEKPLDHRGWESVTYRQPMNLPWLSLTEGMCFILKPDSGIDTCAVLYQEDTEPAAANVAFVSTTDGGATWTAQRDLALTQFYGWGRYRVQGGGSVTTRYFLTRTGITLSVDSNSATTVETAGRVLNVPEVTGP